MANENNEKINILLPEGSDKPVVTVLYGEVAKPLPLKVFKPYQSAVATIQAPQIYAHHLHKHDLLGTSLALVSVYRDDMRIQLQADPNDTDAPTVTGQLLVSEDYKKLQVNTGKRFTLDELRDFIRMNRSYFPDRGAHAALLGAIQSFSASVKTDIQNSKDTRGNAKTFVEKTVDSGGIPFQFDADVQLFKGQGKHRFTVDVCLDVTDGSVRFWFESPDATELIREQRDILLDREIEMIKSLGITVLEF